MATSNGATLSKEQHGSQIGRHEKVWYKGAPRERSSAVVEEGAFESVGAAGAAAAGGRQAAAKQEPLLLRAFLNQKLLNANFCCMRLRTAKS